MRRIASSPAAPAALLSLVVALLALAAAPAPARTQPRKPAQHRAKKHAAKKRAAKKTRPPKAVQALPGPQVPPLPVALPPAAAAPITADVPTPAPTTVAADPLPFSGRSFWRTRLTAAAPIDPESATLTARLVDQVARYGPYVNTTRYTAPVYEVPADQPGVHVTLDTVDPALQAQLDAVPLPSAARGSDGTDGTAIVWQRSTDTLWELWRLRRDADGWHARWGGRIDNVSASDGRFPAPYGVAASGLSILGGLMRPAEVASGRIDHALSLAVPEVTAGTFRWPADRTDGRVVGGGIPLGTRMRLDPSLDVSSLALTPIAREIALAAQRYGVVVTDTAGAVCFAGEDPATFASNPWPDLFGGVAAYRVLAGFPWERMQVLAVPST